MVKCYFSNLLVKFIYGEAFVTDIFELEHALDSDHALHDELQELLITQTSLPHLQCSPKSKTMMHILDYSRQSLA